MYFETYILELKMGFGDYLELKWYTLEIVIGIGWAGLMAKAFKNSQNNADVINERPLMAVVGVQLLVVLVRVIFKMAIFPSLVFL